MTASLGLNRFAAQFRDDAHQALAARLERIGQPEAGVQAMSLSLPEQRTVQYTIDAGWVDRVVRRGETVLHRESYPLPPASVALWRMEPAGRLAIASLVLDCLPPGAIETRSVSEGRSVHRVDAAVGLFSPPATKTEAKP